MEDLNKNQIVLLTLLVSFVTSIATGIVTVTLMDQAPAGVTQTINQVVERTIERVVPAETQTTTVIREVPVVVTEEEQVVKAVAAASPALVRLALVPEKDDLLVIEAVAIGFITGDSGLIISSQPIFPISAAVPVAATKKLTTEPNKLHAVLADGRSLPIKPIGDNLLTRLGEGGSASQNARGVSAWQIDLSAEEVAKLPHVDMSLDQLVVGQRVLALGLDASGRPLVEDGIVSGGPALSAIGGRMATTTATTTPTIPPAVGNFLIITDAVTAENAGGPLLSLSGRVVGVNLSAGRALPSATLLALLAEAVNDATSR